MRVIRISTTAYKEEDFYIATTIEENDIVNILQPIIDLERNGGDTYYNETLVHALQNAFPLEYVKYHIEFDKVTL